MKPTDQITDPSWQDILDRDAEIEKLTDKLDKIKVWCMAYPLGVFIEPDWKAVDEVLKEKGLSLSDVFGSNVRPVVTGIQTIIDANDDDIPRYLRRQAE